MAGSVRLLHSRTCLNSALLVDAQFRKGVIELFQEVLKGTARLKCTSVSHETPAVRLGPRAWKKASGLVLDCIWSCCDTTAGF